MTARKEPSGDARVRSNKSASRWGWLASSTVLAVAFVLPWTLRIDDFLVGALIFLSAAACGIGMGSSVFRGFKPVLCIYMAFTYCWLVVPSAYQISHGVAAWGDSQVVGIRPILVDALTLIFLSLVAVLVGYVLGSGSGRGRDPVLRIYSEDRVFKIATVLLLIAILMIPLVAARTGGLSSFFTSRQALNEALGVSLGSQESKAGRALIKIVPGALALTAALLVADRLRRVGGWRRSTTQTRIYLVAAVSVTLLYWNPLTSTRFIAFAALGSLLLVAVRPVSHKAGLAVLSISLVGLLGLYPLANVFRSETATVRDISFEALATMDFDGFQQAINTFEYVDDRGHTYGMHTLSAALVFVPRSVWEEKAWPASIAVAENRGYAFTNLSLPIASELYMEFGRYCYLVLLFFGICAARLDRVWLTATWAVPVVGYLAMAQIGLIRGPLGSASPIFGFATVVLIVASLRAWPRVSGKLLHSSRGRDS